MPDSPPTQQSTAAPEPAATSTPAASLAPATLRYWTVQPDRWTFSTPKIKQWVESKLDGRVLNACCGVTELDYDGPIHRNDLQHTIEYTVDGTQHTAATNADTHHDVRALDDHLDTQFDVIIYDPPFSAHQALNTYHTTEGQPPAVDTIEALDALLKPGGILIQFGYSSSVIPTAADLTAPYHYEEIHHWNTLGRQYDWFSTIVRKHDPDTPTDALPKTATPTPAWTHSTTTVPNAAANTTTVSAATATSGNGGQPLTLTHQLHPAGTDLRQIARRVASQHALGRVLHLCETNARITAVSDGEVFRVGLAPDVPDARWIPEQELHHAFPDGFFTTVVLDPPPEAFQHNIPYHGETTGRLAALKQELHPLLADDGAVIQLGRTATCMPSDLAYQRRGVTILTHPATACDCIVSIDTPTPSLTDATGVPEREPPTDLHIKPNPADGRHHCLICGQTWYRDPAWYVDCPTCGALPDNYCVGQPQHSSKDAEVGLEAGAVRRVPHAARITAAHDHHRRHECYGPLAALRERRARHTVADDTTDPPTETTLADFS